MTAMATTTRAEAIDALKAQFFDINALRAACAIMEWDQQTYMPKGAGEARAEHLSLLERMAHEILVSDETARLIESASKEAEPDSEDAALVRVSRRTHDQAVKLPVAFVAEKTRLQSLSFESWVKARAENNFAGFAPLLEQMFDIARQEAEYRGYKIHIYDALFDLYEEGATQSDAAQMFATLKQPTIDLVNAIRDKGPVDDSFLYGTWDVHAQQAFTEGLVQKIGFDMNRGRQDTAAHPFCTTFAVGDVRLTTRFKDYLPSAIFGSLHEAGHGMYEQGSPSKYDRTPLAGGVSLGVHESQSRTWENIVGRSHAFWKGQYAGLQGAFSALKDVPLDRFFRAVNKVEPSFIRVEADEVTYNLHVMIRFELECELLTGTLKIADLPHAWNQKYQEYLGITPANDAQGCLQDVHWSGGMIGYFPTYSMGNLLSYQIWGALRADVPDVDSQIEAGNFAPVLGWLTEHVYQHGCRFIPKDLVQRVTGKPLGSEDYLTGLHGKYREIYGIA